jgi:hypothetical protein
MKPFCPSFGPSGNPPRANFPIISDNFANLDRLAKLVCLDYPPVIWNQATSNFNNGLLGQPINYQN